MKVKEWIMAATLIVGLTQIVSASDAVTVVLQNGLDGYSGCVDTYIESKNPTAVHGNSSTLVVQNELCSS